MTAPWCRYCGDAGFITKPCPQCGAFKDRGSGKVVYSASLGLDVGPAERAALRRRRGAHV